MVCGRVTVARGKLATALATAPFEKPIILLQVVSCMRYPLSSIIRLCSTSNVMHTCSFDYEQVELRTGSVHIKCAISPT